MKHEGGFTIVEVLIAVVVLTVGLLGLASTAGYVTRMIGQGSRYTEAATMANQELELLRGLGPSCGSMTAGSRTQGRFSMSWTVTLVTANSQRYANNVQLTVTSPTNTGTRTDSFTGVILCTNTN